MKLGLGLGFLIRSKEFDCNNNDNGEDVGEDEERKGDPIRVNAEGEGNKLAIGTVYRIFIL